MINKRDYIKLCLLGAVALRIATGGAQAATTIGAGSYHSLFIKSDGSLWVMGNDGNGQLGDGNSGTGVQTNRPEVIVSNGVTAIAGGDFHSLFLKSDGSLWAMGSDVYGQLGDGNSGTGVMSTRPEQIPVTNVVAVASGNLANHSLLLKSDGSLWVMGLNSSGQLGDGTTNNSDRAEEIVSSNVTAIAAGNAHSLFLMKNGSLWGMGLNTSGQLGIGNFNNTNVPVEIIASNVTAIAAGGAFSLFIKKDGSLWGMGYNYYGQLGDGVFNNTVSPYGTNLPVEIVSNNVTAVAAGNNFTLFIKSNGSLWGTGYNYYGQLGQGTFDTVSPFGTNVAVLIVSNGVTAIAAGTAHALFIKNDGSLWGMGYNNYGQLGDGTVNNVDVAEEILGGVPAVGISVFSNQPAVFFPSAGTNYVLQMSTNLSSTNWVTVTGGIPINGLIVTNAPGNAYFRLH